MRNLSIATLCCSVFLLIACESLKPTPVASPLAQVAVASASPEATQAGLQILEAGGNAFDAAVAISAALGVAEPYSSGFGGGGLWLIHRAEDGKEIMIDARERAPLAAHRDMYLDADGNVQEELVRWGALSAGIPGLPAGLVHLSENYGKLPLSTNLAPAIKLAEEGFAATSIFSEFSAEFQQFLSHSEAAAALFLKDGKPFPEGELVVQKDLANVIRAIAAEGNAGFYQGENAERLIAGTNAAGGIWSQEDFDTYKIVEREPIVFTYNGMRVVSSPPPSSGGVVMAQVLNILEPYDLSTMTDGQKYHLVVEAMRRAYRDRAEYLGDTDFVEVPLARLSSKEYAAKQRQSINLFAATSSGALRPTSVDNPGGRDTTHFSVIDGDGNRVAGTLTINYPFGACFVPPGTGVLLNNEMDDFSAKPGAANLYGLVGAEANAIAPGKRMLSSMTPTFVESADRIGILGTPGGSRIISMVILSTLAFAEGANAEQMVDLPRYHHQYLPDKLEVEPDALSSELRAALAAKGHTIAPQEIPWGNMHVVLKNKLSGQLDAASDKRALGQAEVRTIGIPK